MNRAILDNNFILISKKNKKIKNFGDLQSELVHLLIYFEFDLPNDFNFIKIPELIGRYRMMEKFSSKFSYEREMKFLKENLFNYFDYDYAKERILALQKESEFKYFEEYNKDLLNLESAIIPKSVLSVDKTGVQSTIKKTKDNYIHEDSENIESNSDSILQDDHKLSSEIEPNSHKNENFLVNQNLLLNRDINFEEKNSKRTDVSSISDESNQINQKYDFSTSIKMENIVKFQKKQSSDSILEDTLELLGLGSLKQNMSKKIILEKKISIGLLFNEWVSENKLWVKLLLEMSNNIENIDLGTELKLLDKINKNINENIDLMGFLNKELEKIYFKLNLN